MTPKLGKVSFISKTTQVCFAKWLYKFTLETLPLEFTVGPGVIRLSYGGVGIHNCENSFIMLVSLIEKIEDCKEVEYYNDVPGIIFELTPLAIVDNLEITAYYYFEELQTYYFELIREIQKRWPETKDQINQILATGILIDQSTTEPIIDSSGKPGRINNEGYDYAYGEMKSHALTMSEAFEIYKKSYPMEYQFTKDHDGNVGKAFQQAMSRRRKKDKERNRT